MAEQHSIVLVRRSVCACAKWLQVVNSSPYCITYTKQRSITLSDVNHSELPKRTAECYNRNTTTSRNASTCFAGVFQLQVRNCGTAFPLICVKLTMTFNHSNGYRYHTEDLFVRVLRSWRMVT